MDANRMVCNDRLWRMLGYRRGDVGLTLRDWNHLVHPDSRAGWAAAPRDHLANPAVPCLAELRIRRPDGDWAAVLSCGDAGSGLAYCFLQLPSGRVISWQQTRPDPTTSLRGIYAGDF